jgi:hypothetical protein
MHHPGVNVHGATVFDSGQKIFRASDHLLAVRADFSALEGRRRQLSLPSPLLTLAVEQPFAEHLLQVSDERVFFERSVVGNHDGFDQLGIEEHQVIGAENLEGRRARRETAGVFEALQRLIRVANQRADPREAGLTLQLHGPVIHVHYP